VPSLSLGRRACRASGGNRGGTIPAGTNRQRHSIDPRSDVPLVGDVHQYPGQELERVGGLGARRRALGLIGRVRHRLGGAVVGQPLQFDGIPGTVAREAAGKRAIVLGDPDAGVHVEPVMLPRQHARGLVLVEQLQPHEQPQHGAAKRLGQTSGLAHWPRHEGTIWPEPAVGDEEMQVRMPVGARPMRLQARHDADGQLTLAGQRPDGCPTMLAAVGRFRERAARAICWSVRCRSPRYANRPALTFVT